MLPPTSSPLAPHPSHAWMLPPSLFPARSPSFTCLDASSRPVPFLFLARSPSSSHASLRSCLRVSPRTSAALMPLPRQPEDQRCPHATSPTAPIPLPIPFFCPLLPCGNTPPPLALHCSTPRAGGNVFPLPTHFPTLCNTAVTPSLLSYFFSHARMLRKCLAGNQPMASRMRNFRDGQSQTSHRVVPYPPR